MINIRPQIDFSTRFLQSRLLRDAVRAAARGTPHVSRRDQATDTCGRDEHTDGFTRREAQDVLGKRWRRKAPRKKDEERDF